MEYITKNQIKNLLPPRHPDTHKGTYGKVLIIAGSEGTVGAAVLAASGALRSGAGLVRVSIDKKLFTIVQGGVCEATCVPRNMSVKALEEYDSIVIGPGLGTGSEGAFALAGLMENYSGNAVIDADALNIAAENNIDFKKTKASLIITPHPGEAGRLASVKTEEINLNRKTSVAFLVKTTGAVTVLKGNATLVGVPGKDRDSSPEVFVNPTGNPGMATGGSGDVLSGVIGSFLAQGMSRENAAIAGVYVHGLAGDLASEKFGEYGTIAGDIADYVALAILNIQKGDLFQ